MFLLLQYSMYTDAVHQNYHFLPVNHIVLVHPLRHSHFVAST